VSGVYPGGRQVTAVGHKMHKMAPIHPLLHDDAAGQVSACALFRR